MKPFHPMKRSVLLLLSLILSASCEKGDSYSTYSQKYRVFFSCETSVSPYNQITTPGRFISVRKNQGKLYLADSDGNRFDMELTAIQNGHFAFGLAGLIIGTPTFNNDNMSVWAYDLGCPECNSPTTRLKFDLHGTATCPKCERSWSLNSGGYPVSDKSRPLYRYPVTLNSGLLTVAN